MKLDISSFEKALRQFQRSLDYLHSDLAREDEGLREQFRAATTQAFEYREKDRAIVLCGSIGLKF